MFTSEEEKNIQIRSMIRFFYLKKYEPEEILEELKEIFGSNVKKSVVYKWNSRFQKGEKDVLVMKNRAGRKRKYGEIEKEQVKDILESNRKLTTRQISNQAGISKATVSRILGELGNFSLLLNRFCHIFQYFRFFEGICKMDPSFSF